MNITLLKYSFKTPLRTRKKHDNIKLCYSTFSHIMITTQHW